MRSLTAALTLALTTLGCARPSELSGRVTKLEGIVDRSGAVYHVAKASSPPAIDGRVDEWHEAPAILLARKDQSGRDWNGPQDLSGKLRLLWDERALYFCLEVVDDVHSAPANEGGWENDCMQFAFDSYSHGPRGSFHADELSYCLADTPSGPVLTAYRRDKSGVMQHEPVPAAEVKMSSRTDGGCVYELALPWNATCVWPWALGRMGFTFTLNDNDGEGFEGALFWTPGLIFGRDASKFGQIVLEGALGSRDAALAMLPEPQLDENQTTSTWIELEGVDPLTTARLLVQKADPTRVDARLTVFRAGERAPLAVGKLRCDVPARGAAAFAWDLGNLPNGRYELVFEAPAIAGESRVRLPYRPLGLHALRSRQRELRERFGVDRPWDDLADAPERIRRHRGLIAAASHWLGEDSALSGDERIAALTDAADMVAALDAGKDYLAAQRGEFWCAHYSPADGSGQPFVAIVPEDFDPRKTYPLMVSLRARMPNRSRVHRDAYIEVSPWGRGGNPCAGLGRNDLLRLIEYMKRWYPVDPRRVFVTGHSAGGSGAWRAAALHPEVFAGAAPVYGWAVGLPLENLRHVPVFNQHGVKDSRVPIDLSRYAVGILQQHGYAVAHKEYPEAGHGLPDQYPVREWMMALRRPERPECVTYTCQSPDAGKAYWLRVRRLADPHRRAEVTARAAGRGKHQMLTLRMANVEVLEFETAGMPVDGQAGLVVQADRAFLRREGPLPDRLFVVRGKDGWALADEWSPPASTARPYRAGAAATLYDGEPLMIVVGTAGPAKRTKPLRLAAEKLARFSGAGEMPVGRFPIKADTEVTDGDMQRFNLIVLGSARDNLLTKRMLPRLPMRIDGEGDLIAGGRDPVGLRGAGVRMAYYNPLAPERLAFLVWTEESGAVAEKWLTDPWRIMTGAEGFPRVNQPDLVVEQLSGGGRRRMQFTHDWTWRKVDGAAVRASKDMADPRKVALAHLRMMRQASGADFALGWPPRDDTPPFDVRYFCLADLATSTSSEPTLLTNLTGEELADIHRRWIQKGEVLIEPADGPSQTRPEQLYRVVMHPSFCSKLRQRQDNLRTIEPGPDVPAEVFIGAGER